MKKSLVIALIFAGSIFSLVHIIIPSYIQPQRPIDPTSLTGEFQTEQVTAVFHGKKISVPAPRKELSPEETAILGYKTPADQKRIEVDLTNQRVYAYEGSRLVYNFTVSTGKWGRTPTGEFSIWVKLRYALMAGGSQVLGTYYYLPNVPYTMYFSNSEYSASQGYSLHGTYWHDNFGHPMSHGCVNMRTEDVEKIYYWATPHLNGEIWGIHANADNPGTKITIYGTAPQG